MHEVVREGVYAGGRNIIEVEDGDDEYILYLVPVGINKVYRARVKKELMSDVDKFHLNPITRPSKRIK